MYTQRYCEFLITRVVLCDDFLAQRLLQTGLMDSGRQQSFSTVLLRRGQLFTLENNEVRREQMRGNSITHV